jgi:formylglycine-generating enzyme
MNRSRLLQSATLASCLATGAMACNAIVGNDSVSLWDGDSGSSGDGAVVQTGADTSVDGESPDATVDAPVAEGAADSPPDAESGADGATDGAADGADGGSCADACNAGVTGCAPGQGAVQKCEVQANGCTQWVTDPVCSAAGKVCASASASATCSADPQGCFYESASSVCTDQTCVSGSCSGVCGPGQVTCSGSQPESCGTSGQWQDKGASCSNSLGTFCSGGACTAPPSCAVGAGGTTNCGTSSSLESCCTSPAVTGGTYHRTYTNSGDGGTGEADPASVTGFRLDKYDVTVGRFRQFVNAWAGGAGYTPPAGSGKHTHLNGGQGLTNSESPGTFEPGWVASDNGNIAPTNTNLACQATYATWTSTSGNHESLPINCVNWFESYAFCIWDGGFLPSESEWEYAAAGGSQQREYPWGTTAPGTASQYAIYGCYYPSGTGSCTAVTNIAPVGSATSGAGLWGQLDLAGNMWQWTLDVYNGAYVNPCTDCAYFSSVASGGVLRGGSYPGPAASLVPVIRNNLPPTDRNANFGFRCARTP